MKDGPGSTAETGRDPLTEGAEGTVADLEVDALEAHDVRGGGAPVSDMSVTKQTDSASVKL